MEQTEVTRNQIVNELLRIGHGDLKIYSDTGLKAVKVEPELFAHLIAWNEKKGEVRDSKKAFPILALRGEKDDELYENAAAHLCLLSPRDLVSACRYHRELPPAPGAGWIKKAINKFLTERERNQRWWDATVLQHRESIKTLYAMYHIPPTDRTQAILFEKKYPPGSVFEKVKELKNMKPDEAAGTILNHKIPFLIAVGALGGIKGKTDILLALIERMSGSELINNTAMLQKAGVFENPALKAAYDSGISRAKKDKKVATLKAGKAAKILESVDAKVAAKLDNLQEEKLSETKIDGDWLVLGDRSGSMDQAVDLAKQVAALIAHQVSGKVYLVFFNDKPTFFDVSGKSLTEIQEQTKRVSASGMTSIGCGLDYLTKNSLSVNGISIVSDGGDNTNPRYHQAYAEYSKKMGIQPTTYLFHVSGDVNHLDSFCKREGIGLETFEIGSHVDYYSLGMIVKMMRSNMYSLVNEIMEIPLLTFDKVFKGK